MSESVVVSSKVDTLFRFHFERERDDVNWMCIVNHMSLKWDGIEKAELLIHILCCMLNKLLQDYALKLLHLDAFTISVYYFYKIKEFKENLNY